MAALASEGNLQKAASLSTGKRREIENETEDTHPYHISDRRSIMNGQKNRLLLIKTAYLSVNHIESGQADVVDIEQLVDSSVGAKRQKEGAA